MSDKVISALRNVEIRRTVIKIKHDVCAILKVRWRESADFTHTKVALHLAYYVRCGDVQRFAVEVKKPDDGCETATITLWFADLEEPIVIDSVLESTRTMSERESEADAAARRKWQDDYYKTD